MIHSRKCLILVGFALLFVVSSSVQADFRDTRPGRHECRNLRNIHFAAEKFSRDAREFNFALEREREGRELLIDARELSRDAERFARDSERARSCEELRYDFEKIEHRFFRLKGDVERIGGPEHRIRRLMEELNRSFFEVKRELEVR